MLECCLTTPKQTGPRAALHLCPELACYKVDIAALSGTRFTDKGQLIEPGVDYTFSCRGHSSRERCEARVGFAIKTTYAQKLKSIQKY